MKKIKIGLVGLGIVGKSVYEVLVKDKNLINARSLNQLELAAVSSRNKRSFVNEEKIKFYANPLDLANDPQIDVVVEMIGGDEIAYQICEAALKNGKKVVTANKALLATKGYELAKIADLYQSHILFEAAVGGATPMVKIFKQSFAANEIKEFYAILNGTCNYILTKMKNENIDFAAALKQAQDLGYAESDPTFDIEGIDAAHKLALLAAIASGSRPHFDKVFVEGISKITIDDIFLAEKLGYKIKLLGVYKSNGNYRVVYPALISDKEKIANIDESFNAIFTKASNAGNGFLAGNGAGGFPTASAIVADLVDIANNRYDFMFGIKNQDLVEPIISKVEDRIGQYFIKLVLDKNLALQKKLDQKILDEIKVRQSYYYEQESKIICGFLTQDIQEKHLINLLENFDKDLVKKTKFLRVEQTGF